MKRRFASIALMLFLAGCGQGKSSVDESRSGASTVSPAKPLSCRELTVSDDLQAAIDEASPGDAFCLTRGVWHGPITVAAGVAVWGPRDAVIRSNGTGTTVMLEGRGPKLLGVTVDGSGTRFDILDAAVRVRGEEAVVEGVEIVNATFGILVEKSKEISLRHNVVKGDSRRALGMRGDGIRLWETTNSVLEGNQVENSRDIVVWYSRNNSLFRNRVVGGRYGTHFMYSHDNRVERNEFRGNEVGVFVMYSRGVVLSDNLMAEASGAAGIGLGVKESGNIVVRNNRFLHNTVGAYLDSSPIQMDEHNVFERNVFRLGEVGIVFHSSLSRNTFKDNSFRDNYSQVRVEGGGDALDVTWEGNDFDDYAGYDLDGDGIGDIPYELRSLSGDLVSRHPSLAFFRGSPTLALISAAGEIVPLLAPKVVLRDARPRIRSLEMEGEDAN